jgi:hypothetical protein
MPNRNESYYVVEHQLRRGLTGIDGPYEKSEAKDIRNFLEGCCHESVAREYKTKKESKLTEQEKALIH